MWSDNLFPLIHYVDQSKWCSMIHNRILLMRGEGGVEQIEIDPRNSYWDECVQISDWTICIIWNCICTHLSDTDIPNRIEPVWGLKMSINVVYAHRDSLIEASAQMHWWRTIEFHVWGMCVENWIQVPPRFELGSLDSESKVIAATPWDHNDTTRSHLSILNSNQHLSIHLLIYQIEK